MSLSLANLVVLIASGAHAVVPSRLVPRAEGASAPAGGRGMGASPATAWRALGPLLLVSGALALLWIVHRDPDGALAADLTALPGRTAPALLALGAMLLPAAGHLANLLARGATSDSLAARRTEALIGSLGLLAMAFVLVSLRIGAPEPGAGVLRAGSVALTALLGLAAGELVAPGRPRWSPLVGLALLADPFLLSSGLRETLIARLDVLTLGAGALLVAIARWLPVRLRRPALAAGLLLAALYFDRVRELAAPLIQLHGGMELIG